MEGFFTAARLDDVATRVVEVDVVYVDLDEYWSVQTALANHIRQHIRKMPTPDIKRLKRSLRQGLPKELSGRIANKARANPVKGRVPR